MPTIVMEHRHSPALLIPPAFGIEDFRRLIDIFHTRGKTFFEQKVAADRLGTDYKMRVPKQLREYSIDQFFFDRGTVVFLKQRLNRLTREIFRALQYRTSKHESLRAAQYEGAQGGLGFGHRDNIPPFTQRRFAMSKPQYGRIRGCCLGSSRVRRSTLQTRVRNSDYIFIVSLHEVMQMTAGRRSVFLAFLLGET
jgi:hypothetical protein